MNKTTSGLINGFLGMLIFSGSLPATRAAIGSFDPVFLTVARASIAGLLGCGLLLMFRPAKPNLAEIAALAMVSLCVVIGFPLLTAYALQHIPSARSLVFIALLPLSTALFAVLRGGERPRPIFWLFSSLGSALVVGFALSQGAATASYGDMLMILAILICGLGYAEGAKLSRRLGGWQVISWALTLALPISVVAAAFTLPPTLSGVTAGAWFGLGYVSLFSMLIGFIFWYRGLAQGGIAAIGQLQLLQPFFGLALAAALLHETVSASMLITTLAVVACVTGARRATL